MTIIPITINGLPKLRLIADDGMVITNGIDKFRIIDVDAVDEWREEADNVSND